MRARGLPARMSGVGRRLGLAGVRCAPLGSWDLPVSTGVSGHSCQAFPPSTFWLQGPSRFNLTQNTTRAPRSEKHGWVATGSNALEPVTSPDAFFWRSNHPMCCLCGQPASLTNPRHTSYFLFRDEWSPGDRNREVERGTDHPPFSLWFQRESKSGWQHHTIHSIRLIERPRRRHAEDAFPPTHRAATHSHTSGAYLAASHRPVQSSTPRLSSLVPIKAP